ncbi:MAG: Lrp/AsnC family transcriptional regulator [Chloroflexi bacterium]|jgi:Lrp/AsnC family transcriptional regulator, regulator for asnA, asnC and gidA|nr:Lrp/AsnC family transcriptional regulator [Chloroflexota bacterium]
MKVTNDKSSRKLDAMDLKLIEELEVDGRQTNAELARRIGTSKATARRKLNALLDEGVIRVLAVADPSALGYKTVVTMGINVHPGEVDNVAEKLASYGNIRFVIISAGRYDVIAWAMFKESEDLSDFIRNELGNIRGLLSAETMIYLDIKKFSITYVGD